MVMYQYLTIIIEASAHPKYFAQVQGKKEERKARK